MSKPKILVQLDPDPHPSVFDAVVALDAGVDHLLSYRGVQPADVRTLVHGAMFTRGGEHLRRTAIFVGGSDVRAGETLVAEVLRTFFGPLRVSVMLDANGANTTAAAAVLTAAEHLDLARVTATVAAGTGPVGQRVARLLVRCGATVHVTSRRQDRAEQVCQQIAGRVPGARLVPFGVPEAKQFAPALQGSQVLIAAGAEGQQLVPREIWSGSATLRVAIDLNAVPPSGIEGIDAPDRGRQLGDVVAYGAVGVGGLKMKIHKAAIGSLFEAHDQVLDAEQIFDLGQSLRTSAPGRQP